MPGRARILSAIPAIVNRYHLCRWHHRAHRRWGTGRKNLLQQCVSSLSDRKQRWQELELPVVSLSERIQPVEPVSLERSDFVERQKKNTGNKTPKRKMEYWSTIPRVMTTFHLWSERLICTSEEVPTSEDIFAPTAE